MGNHNLKSIIREGTVENVKEYLKHEPDMKNHVFRYGWTATHLAVEYHKLDILKFLVEEEEADLKHIDNALSNLLHHALHFAEEHFDIVKYLLENGHFKFDNAKDEHENTTLHLAFKYCSLKQIAELTKYYKGCKELFQEKNDHHLTPLSLLKERCKNQPESLVIVERLQEEIERASSDDEGKKGGSRHGSGDDKKEGSGIRSSGSKHGSKLSSSGDEHKGSKLKHKKESSGDLHEEKDETKKHSDEDKDDEGKKGSKKKHTKHDENGKKAGSKHKKASKEEKTAEKAD